MFKRKVEISKIQKNKKEILKDVVLYETPIDLYVNSKPLVNIICLANDLKELSVGFLFSIGIIESIKDIKEISVDEIENNIFVELKKENNFDIDTLDVSAIDKSVYTDCHP